MKLLFDENLSRKLIPRLSDLYPASAHVVALGLSESPDQAIWQFAKTEGFMVVTTDADFYEMAMTSGPPPKVVWLRRWAQPTNDAKLVLRREAIRIAHFANDPELAVLVLDRN